MRKASKTIAATDKPISAPILEKKEQRTNEFKDIVKSFEKHHCCMYLMEKDSCLDTMGTYRFSLIVLNKNRIML